VSRPSPRGKLLEFQPALPRARASRGAHLSANTYELRYFEDRNLEMHAAMQNIRLKVSEICAFNFESKLAISGRGGARGRPQR
jgi:hypothetical protein